VHSKKTRTLSIIDKYEKPIVIRQDKSAKNMQKNTK